VAEPVLIVRLLGGLGNQLFQYATGRAAAQQLGVPLRLDARYLARKGHHSGLALEAFNITAEQASPAQLARFPQWKIQLTRGLRKLVRPLGGIYHEHGTGFDPRALQRRPGQMLSGFWQSERYFQPVADTLRTELTLCQPLPDVAEPLLHAMHQPGSVALHVRRGDYVRNAAALARHGVCSAAYYRAGVAHIAAAVAQPTFFVFSDDPAWAQQALGLPANSVYVSGPRFRPEHDLVMISACQHQIIANSTFSWWGAWLNPNPRKIVIAPTPWYDDPALGSHDLIPESWTQLDKQG